MTIRDLMEQGIRIQGAFQIKKWDDAEETYTMLAEGSQFEFESCDIEEEVLDMEIKYILAFLISFKKSSFSQASQATLTMRSFLFTLSSIIAFSFLLKYSYLRSIQ